MNHMDVGGVRHGTSSELRQAVKNTSRCVIGIDLARGDDFTAIGNDIYHNGAKVHCESGRMVETK